MDKDFNRWNEQKKVLEQRQDKVLFKEGEIWWCAIGLNIGNESCGKGETFRRPILILKKLSGSQCIGIPLSTQKKVGSWFTEILVQNRIQYILLYQIRMFSVYRFQRRITVLETSDFMQVKRKLEALLELSNNHQDITPGSVGNPKAI
jgi:mRNA interferase MazF